MFVVDVGVFVVWFFTFWFNPVQKIDHHFRKSPITIVNLDTITIITLLPEPALGYVAEASNKHYNFIITLLYYYTVFVRHL